MKFTCYPDWDQLSEKANKLFAQTEKESIFYTRQWFEIISAYLDKDESIILACVESGEDIVAMLPLVQSVGHSYTALKHRYSPHYSVLLYERDPLVLTCLAEGLSTLSLGGLLLEPVTKDNQQLNSLVQALQSTGYDSDYLFRHYNWIYRTEGQSFQDYMSSRPPQQRNTIIRKQKKLEREQKCHTEIYTGDEVPKHMEDYYAVYKASWKANEQYIELVDDIVSAFSEKDWTRLAVLYINGKAAAFQLWFVCHGKASIFRLSYDEAWKKYSPGSILTRAIMEYVIDTDKVDEIDFLTGNEKYKQDWMSDRCEYYGLSLVKKPLKQSPGKKMISKLAQLLKFNTNK